MRATLIVVGALFGAVLIANLDTAGADTCSDSCDKAYAACSKSCNANNTDCFTKCINERQSCLVACK